MTNAEQICAEIKPVKSQTWLTFSAFIEANTTEALACLQAADKGSLPSDDPIMCRVREAIVLLKATLAGVRASS